MSVLAAALSEVQRIRYGLSVLQGLKRNRDVTKRRAYAVIEQTLKELKQTTALHESTIRTIIQDSDAPAWEMGAVVVEILQDPNGGWLAIVQYARHSRKRRRDATMVLDTVPLDVLEDFVRREWCEADKIQLRRYLGVAHDWGYAADPERSSDDDYHSSDDEPDLEDDRRKWCDNNII